MQRTLIVIIIALGITGCGGYDCYYDPYYCGYYRAAHEMVGLKIDPDISDLHTRSGTVTKKRGGFAGRWNVSLHKGGGDCPSLPADLIGVATLSTQKDSISLSIPRYGRYTGKVRRNQAKIRGRYHPLLLPCSADVSITYTLTGPSGAKVRALGNVSCSSGAKCSVEYLGSATR